MCLFVCVCQVTWSTQIFLLFLSFTPFCLYHSLFFSFSIFSVPSFFSLRHLSSSSLFFTSFYLSSLSSFFSLSFSLFLVFLFLLSSVFLSLLPVLLSLPLSSSLLHYCSGEWWWFGWSSLWESKQNWFVDKKPPLSKRATFSFTFRRLLIIYLPSGVGFLSNLISLSSGLVTWKKKRDRVLDTARDKAQQIKVGLPPSSAAPFFCLFFFTCFDS